MADLLFEKFFTHPTKLTAFCRPFALIAVVAEPTHDVQVFRINGQLAYTIRRRSAEVEVTAVEFKPDGSVLAIGHSDGVCTLHSGENGKFTGQLSVRKDIAKDDWKLDLTPDYGIEEDETVKVAVQSIYWCKHTPPTPRSSRSQSSSAPEPPLEPSKKSFTPYTTDEWADSVTDDQRLHSLDPAVTATRLTSELVGLDVTTVLPKLSIIPASHGARHGAESGLFSSQANVDNLLSSITQAHGGKSQPGTAEVDLLVVSSGQGDTVVMMDDTVRIGDTTLNYDIILRSSRPEASHHAYLCRSEGKYGMQYLDLPISSLGSPLLSVISTNTKRTQSLVSYIVHTVRCIEHDWTTGLTFPKRLIKNISDELAEKEQGDLVTNLCHLAMTGVFTEVMEEWLTDILKETNHKRWDSAISNMYTHIQDHIFFNLLPALDRLAIATTTLRGHAAFDEGSDGFDVSPQLFTNILEGVDSLRLIAQKAQLRVMTEHRQFAAFSKWLRVMIDVGMAKGTKAAIEIEEREAPNIDYGLVLAYLKETLNGSELELIVGQIPSSPTCDREDFFANSMIKRRFYTATIDAFVSLAKNELPEAERTLLNMSSAAVFLNGHARDACDNITAWQSRMIPQSHPKQIVPTGRLSEVNIKDMKLSNRRETSVDYYTVDIVATETQDRSPNCLWLLRTIRMRSPDQQAQQSPVSVEEPLQLECFNDSAILDVKLHRNESVIMLLRASSGEYSLALRDFSGRSELKTLYEFPENSPFKPQQLVLGGTLCVLIGHGGRQWQVLELREQY